VDASRQEETDPAPGAGRRERDKLGKCEKFVHGACRGACRGACGMGMQGEQAMTSRESSSMVTAAASSAAMSQLLCSFVLAAMKKPREV